VIRTLDAAAAWIDEVGLALVFPKADVVLLSLWEQVNGSPEQNWAVRDTEGTFLHWSDELAFLWGAKDDLPQQGLACVGKHVARVATCVAPRLVHVLAAAVEPVDPSEDERAVLDAIRSEGPLTGPQLRRLTALQKRELDKAIAGLHRRLVLTNAYLVEGDGVWGALAHDLVSRKWRLPERLPDRTEARLTLARLMLEQANELTAADLGGPFGWRRRVAADLLDEIAPSREEDGFRIWGRN
jgi:hypothetical protein